MRSIDVLPGVYVGMIQKTFESFRFVYNLLGKLKRKFWTFVAISICISLWETVLLVSLLSLVQTLMGEFGVSETNAPARALTSFARDIGARVPQEWRVVLGIVGTSIIVLVNSLGTYYIAMYQVSVSTTFLMNLRNGIFRQLIRSTIGFFDKQKKGDLINLVVFETRSVYNILKGGLAFFLASTRGLVFFSMMMLLSWKLTAIFVAFSVLFLIETVIASEAMRKKSKKVVEGNRSLTGEVETLSRSIKQVKLYNLYEEIQKRFLGNTRKVDETSRDLVRLQALQRVILNAVTLGFLVTIGLLSFYFPIIAVSGLITFLYLSQRAAAVLFQINSAVGLINRNLPVISNIQNYYSGRRENEEDREGREKTVLLEEAVRWENITHAFDEQVILQSVNIAVKKGERVAFVGHSGCGKTTLINLLCGLYRPTAGKISIDRDDLRSLKLDFVRSKIGVVTQDTVLFDKTIWENLLHGRDDVSNEEVVSAAIDTRVEDFVSRFPEGYGTKVGEGGSRLSGGERQRISIAQALIRDPEILILDEGTSGLDIETEDFVLNSLCSSEKTFTLILVAHRISTIKRADRIIVLERGHVVEEGTWRYLMSTKGSLFKMVSKGEKTGELQ